MFDAARLRLTGWYMAILTVVVAALSFALYRILINLHYVELHAINPTTRGPVARLFSRHEPDLLLQVLGVDLGVLLLAGIGAYALAGRTLQPIRQAMARQQQFAAAASHELRTPLTVLQGTMEVALLRDRAPADYQRLLANAVDEVSRMGLLVTDLLQLARAEHDRETLTMAALDARAIFEEVAVAMQPVAEGKKQYLDVELDGPLPLRGDAIKLRQAVMNLVDNAVRYTPAGGTVRIGARRAGNRALIEVRDSGPGIAARHLQHIFEPFYRVDTARSGGEGHVGMGLALAAWIVRAHGGQITVSSHLGEGTAFTLSLPLAAT